MNKPYIIVNDGGKHRKVYRKLFCYSIIGIEKIPKVRLVMPHIVKDGKKIVIGSPIALGDSDTNLQNAIKQLQKIYKLDDVYVDKEGFSVMHGKEYDTIDVYFEKY